MKRLNFEREVAETRNFHMADLTLEKSLYVGAHCHDFYEFFIVMKGQFQETCNGRTILLRRRHLHILKPDDTHILKCGKESDVNVLRNVAIKASVFKKIAEELDTDADSMAGYYIVDENMFSVFTAKTEMLYGPYPDGTAFNFIMESLVKDVMIASVLQRSSEYGIPGWLRRAYALMEEEENFYAGLPRLIELTGKSQEYLTRSFKRYYKMTPTSYINQIRLQHAAKLLRNTRDSVLDIVYRCGYNSVSYFNRQFKSHYGTTPSRYREKGNFVF
ncbi:MAG: AraC family transcriptional regulator [Christensenellales bacterium]